MRVEANDWCEPLPAHPQPLSCVMRKRAMSRERCSKVAMESMHILSDLRLDVDFT